MNESRAHGTSFLKELVRITLFTVGIFTGLHVLECLMMVTLCPEAMPPPNHPHPHHDPFHHRRSLSEFADDEGNVNHGHGPFRGPDNTDDDDDHHGLPHECEARLLPASLALIALALALFITLALYLARRRTALRERFGLEGSVRGDRCLYFFCTPCALAQETRTLMHEQVHEGVWYGALPGVAPPPPVHAVGIPMPQKMVV